MAKCTTSMKVFVDMFVCLMGETVDMAAISNGQFPWSNLLSSDENVSGNGFVKNNGACKTSKNIYKVLTRISPRILEILCFLFIIGF